MKLKNIATIGMGVALMALGTLHAANNAKTTPGLGLQAPEKIQKWQSVQSKTTTEKSQKSNFYTGKPYDVDKENYIFKYRNLDPELGRWTVADPSGFPDGANTWLYTRNSVTSEFDSNGLDTQTISGDYTVTAHWTEVEDFESTPEGWSIETDGVTFMLVPERESNFIWKEVGNVTYDYTGNRVADPKLLPGPNWYYTGSATQTTTWVSGSPTGTPSYSNPAGTPPLVTRTGYLSWSVHWTMTATE